MKRRILKPLSSLVISNGLQTGPFGSQLKAAEYLDNGIPVVMPKDIKNGKITSKTIAKISKEKTENLKKHLIQEGDIIFPRRGDLGRIAVALKQNSGWICGTGCLRARLKINIFPPYIHQYVQLSQIKKWLERNALGQTMLNLNTDIIGELSIFLPDRKDQEAIARLLSTADIAIQKTEALIAAKKKRFEWLQNMLINTKVCSKYIENSPLGYFSKILKKEKITSVEGFKPLTVKLHCKGIKENTRDVKIQLSSKGRPYFPRKCGEFLIGRQNFHNGGFGIVPEALNDYIASNAITSLDIDESKLKSDFLFYYFSRKDYYLKIGHIMDGTGQKELSDKQIMKLPMSIPPIEKQQKIVHILNTAQKEIQLLEQLVEKYRTQKRGLMQKLLTGEWRVRSAFQTKELNTCKQI